jgi:release factor glutamine methyltransferase
MILFKNIFAFKTIAAMPEMSISIQNVYKSTVLKLKNIYTLEEAHAMADRLFEYHFQLLPVQRVLSGTSVADERNIALLDVSINKLLLNVPLQYITGTAFFMGLDFEVNSSVLIPRPETEELVSLVLKSLNHLNGNKTYHILDIGTGSGCIAISLKRFLPTTHVTALDISGDALKVAKGNAIKNNVSVDFIETDILNSQYWNDIPNADLIISNPPYVTHAEKHQMQPNVLNYEPHTALFVSDKDPLLFYRVILDLAKIKLQEGGTLWFEINEAFGDDILQLSLNQGFVDANIIFDFQGKSRFLQCRK